MIRSVSDDNGQGPPREPTLTDLALAASQAEVSRLSAEVAGLGAERDNATAEILRQRAKKDALEETVRVRNEELFAARGACKRLEDERDAARTQVSGLREVMRPAAFNEREPGRCGFCGWLIERCDNAGPACRGVGFRLALSTPTGTAAVPLLVQVGIGYGSWTAVGDPLLHEDNAVSFIGTGGRRYKTKPGNWRSNYPPPLATGAEVIHGIFDPTP